MADPEELLTVAEIAATLKMNQRSIKRSDFDALLESSYTRKPQMSAGMWNGEVPTPVAPEEHAERKASPPDTSGDAISAESDEVAE